MVTKHKVTREELERYFEECVRPRMHKYEIGWLGVTQAKDVDEFIGCYALANKLSAETALQDISVRAMVWDITQACRVEERLARETRRAIQERDDFKDKGGRLM